MFRKRLRIFFRLKKEECIRCLLAIGEVLKIAFLVIGTVTVSVFGSLFILGLLGFLITLGSKYPLSGLLNNPSEERWPIYIMIGGVAVLGPLLLFFIGFLIKEFIKLIQSNWEEAGRLAEKE